MELLHQYSNLADGPSVREQLAKLGLDSRPEPGTAASKTHAHAPRLLGTQVDEVVRRYEGGETIRAIAERLDISRPTVSAYLRRRGVSARRRPLTPDQVGRAVSAYAKGKSVAVIGAGLGVDGTTVWRALIRFGVALRDPQGRERGASTP